MSTLEATEPVADDRYDDIVEHFDDFARQADTWAPRTDRYHSLIDSIFRALIPAGASVLEIGSGRGDLLEGVSPKRGVGIEISPEMVSAARERHPHLEFVEAPGESIELGETFDYIVLSDLVPYVYDLQHLMDAVRAHCHSRTRVIAHTYSNLWRLPLAIMERLEIRPVRPTRNWVATRDLINLFELSGFQVVGSRAEILLPVRSSALSAFFNGFLARLPLLRSLTLTHWLIARPLPSAIREPGVSVVVPCRNEAGSIETLVQRLPDMGRATEIIFIEGGSRDDTRARIEETIAAHPDRDIRFMTQTGSGKANAVHEAFAEAKHEMLMILDADLSVAPEDLPKFYDALASGRGELVNGSRLVYGMEAGAMRFLNMVANRAFAVLMSFVLGQYVKDTLCGTKALMRDDYLQIMAQRQEIEADDPFGDFDFLLGASLAGFKILNVPVRYAARTYGETNIQRFSEGGQLARLAVAGFRRIWVRPLER